MTWRLCVLILTSLCSPTLCLPHQYHFINSAVPWLKARTYCRERHTDLATVFNIEDMNRLVNTAQDSTGGFTGKAWIGLHDNLTSWRWSFSDSRYYRDKEGDYRNWDFGEPDNFLGDQMCVKMWSGGVWEDSRCFLRNPFICYDGSTGSAQRFVFVEQELSWSDAQLYCRKHYTDLASVRNEEENQEIQQLAKNRSVWIGLYRTREWSDQSISTYRYWKQGQPDNVGGTQNCTATDLGNAGLWSDERCSRELVFICYGEKVADKTPVMPVLPTTTTVAPIKRTSTESTTAHLSTEMTPSEQPSAPHVDQTRTITGETPKQPVLSTTAERDSTSAELSSQQYSTPKVDQTRRILEHVINLRVKFTSTIHLSEDDIRELLVWCRSQLIEMGLPSSIKVGFKTPLK